LDSFYKIGKVALFANRNIKISLKIVELFRYVFGQLYLIIKVKKHPLI